MHSRSPLTSNDSPPDAATQVHRIGCVGFLNSLPLIHGAADWPDTTVTFDVPSRLLDALLGGGVDLALCPVIDYFTSPDPLQIVPVGGIGCEGRTLTVRLFSRVPPEDVVDVKVDADSHTSINLLRILFAERYGRSVNITRFDARHEMLTDDSEARPEAMLLIGDKVVAAEPSRRAYPFQIDLGEAWGDLTGLPFVFAVWMTRQDAPLGDLPGRLEQLKHRNLARLNDLIDAAAPANNWPVDIARTYLGRLLCYEIGPRQLQAIERFALLAHRHGLIDRPRPLDCRPS